MVLEVLSGEKSAGQIAQAYDILPNTVTIWKKQFLDKGAEVFGQDNMVSEYERRIAELEQLVGNKEVEIVLFNSFLGRRA